MKNSRILIVVILLLGAALMISGCNAAPGTRQAENGDTVQVGYTGKLADGTVFDSSLEGEPLEFTLGAGEVIPGFEKAVLGMKVGEKKTVTIPVNEAYGPPRDELIVEVPRDELSSSITPQVGMRLQQVGTDGSVIIAVITKVSDATVTLDANHPLAGKDLTFEIELVSIK